MAYVKLAVVIVRLGEAIFPDDDCGDLAVELEGGEPDREPVGGGGCRGEIVSPGLSLNIV